MSQRENNARVTVTVDGVNLGAWEERSGGAATGTTTMYNLAGMGPRVALGGRQEYADNTVRKIKDADITSRLKWLYTRQNKGRMVVAEQPLDDEGMAVGEPMVWRGVLKHVGAPNANSNSDAAAIVELQQAVESVA